MGTPAALSNFKLVNYKTFVVDESLRRRESVINSISVQRQILDLCLEGKDYAEHIKGVRPWFKAQNGGYIVQCRFGSAPVLLDAKNDSIFVKTLEDVGSAFDALVDALNRGDLDNAIAAQARKLGRRVRPSKD